jgi:myo-inositol-1(or 4)-monophosphatase
MKECLACIDFKRLDKQARLKFLEKMPFKSQRNIGTCALEWAWLAAGRIQLLLHGGEKLWDYAAGTLLVSEAGGSSCSFDREPIYNQSLDPRPVVAAANASLQQQWIEFLDI